MVIWGSASIFRVGYRKGACGEREFMRFAGAGVGWLVGSMDRCACVDIRYCGYRVEYEDIKDFLLLDFFLFLVVGVCWMLRGREFRC